MWYVVQTMSGREEKCMELCRKKLEEGCCRDIFVPRYVTKRRYQKSWHDKEQILFPGYFFVDTTEIKEVVGALREIPQFARVLKNADQIAPVTEQERGFLEDIMDENHIVRHSEGFLIGDQVYIMEGPLRNWRGLVRKVDRHRRIAYLEVNLFGRMTPMEVGFSAVARLTKQEFDRIKKSNENADKEGTSCFQKKVRILSGIFEGMTGELFRADKERDEWTVQLKLFGKEPSRVVFHRNEIEILS